MSVERAHDCGQTTYRNECTKETQRRDVWARQGGLHIVLIGTFADGVGNGQLLFFGISGYTAVDTVSNAQDGGHRQSRFHERIGTFIADL